MSWIIFPWSESSDYRKMNMTYQQLLEQLQQLDENQLQQNVSIYDEHLAEYYPTQGSIKFATSSDILDNNHPFLTIW